jgi:signal transduction histidine kinase
MSRDNAQVMLLVEDDGVGITKPQGKTERQSFGLAGIKERIGTLGGKVRVTSSKGKGTRVEVTVPVESQLEGSASQLSVVRTEAAPNAEAVPARAALATGTTGSGA